MKNTYDIALIGTSLITSHKDRNWHLALARYMQPGKSKRIRTHSLGQNGATSSWGRDNTGPVTRLRPDAVLIEFVNDALASEQAPAPAGMTPALSAANFGAIIDAVRNAAPDTAIYLMTLIRPRADAAEAVFPTLASYYGLLPALALTKGVGMIDCYAAWGDPALHPEDFPEDDGAHPNLSGYLRVSIPTIAAQLAPLID